MRSGCPEVYVERESAPDPRPLLPRWLARLVTAVVCLAIIAGLYAYARGVVNEYDRVTRELIKAETRAQVAEAALAEVIRAGDGGILLATVNTVDMGRVGLYVRPVGRK